MSNSHYMDKLVKQMDEESKASYVEDRKYIEDSIKKFQGSWKSDSRMENIVLPLASLYFFVRIFYASSMIGGVFYSLPFLSVLTLTVMQLRANRATDSIDCALAVTDFFKYRYNLFYGQIKLMQRMRYFFYAPFAIYAVAYIFVTPTPSIWVALLYIIYNFATLGYIGWYFEKSIEELIKKRHASKY